MPHVGGRHRDVFGEAPVTIDTDHFRIRTRMRVAGSTEQAPSIHDVSFDRHPIADMDIGDQRPDLRDVPGEFVPNDERRVAPPARPVIPLVNMDVGAAHARAAHADQHFVIANGRYGHILELETGGCSLFDERVHAIYCSNRWSGSVFTRHAAGVAAPESCRSTADDARGISGAPQVLYRVRNDDRTGRTPPARSERSMTTCQTSSRMKKRTKHGHSGQSTDRSAAWAETSRPASPLHERQQRLVGINKDQCPRQ